jgi:site-specific DNA-methyltransferase (adenine-specific)
LATGSIDLILTDPPFATTAAEWDVPQDWAPYASEFRRVLKPSGTLVMFGVVRSLTVADRKLSAGFDLRHDLIWVKATATGALRVSPKSSEKAPAHSHENIWVWAPKGTPPGSLTFNEKAVRRSAQKWPGSKHRAGGKLPEMWGGGDAPDREVTRLAKAPCKCATDVFFEDNVRDGALYVQKPFDLMRYLTVLYSNPGEVVLDPFAGTGVTLRAAWVTARRSIGYEANLTTYRTLEKGLK